MWITIFAITFAMALGCVVAAVVIESREDSSTFVR
jgi:hypothetical protein